MLTVVNKPDVLLERAVRFDTVQVVFRVNDDLLYRIYPVI